MLGQEQFEFADFGGAISILGIGVLALDNFGKIITNNTYVPNDSSTLELIELIGGVIDDFLAISLGMVFGSVVTQPNDENLKIKV